MILERVSPSLPDDLSRWQVEIQARIFVGKVKEVMRKANWERALRQ